MFSLSKYSKSSAWWILIFLFASRLLLVSFCLRISISLLCLRILLMPLTFRGFYFFFNPFIHIILILFGWSSCKIFNIKSNYRYEIADNELSTLWIYCYWHRNGREKGIHERTNLARRTNGVVHKIKASLWWMPNFKCNRLFYIKKSAAWDFSTVRFFSHSSSRFYSQLDFIVNSTNPNTNYTVHFRYTIHLRWKSSPQNPKFNKLWETNVTAVSEEQIFHSVRT